MTITPLNSNDPKEHAQHLEKYISELRDFCHAEIKRVNDPKAQALFETTAEVLTGLEKAFSDFQSENEGAWVNDPDRTTIQ